MSKIFDSIGFTALQRVKHLHLRILSKVYLKIPYIQMYYLSGKLFSLI